MSDAGQDRHDEPEEVGSLAEEAAKLLGVLGDWARDQGGDLGDLGQGAAGLAGQAAAAARDVGDHLAGAPIDTGAPECRWCPVCRTVHAARRLSPDVVEQLGVAATALLRAGSGIMAALAAEAGPPGSPGATPRRPVERIDLDEPDDPDPDDRHDHPHDHTHEDPGPDPAPGGAR